MNKNNSFHPYIKAVGTGTKHNHNLTSSQMHHATDLMLNQDEIYSEQISAFLLGWRIKGETIDEFKGMLSSFDTFIQKTTIVNSIELGYPYDGKKNNPYLFSLIAKYLKKFDINIIVSGDKLQPAKNGITVQNICESSKLDFSDNLHYFPRSKYFKELSNLSEIRNRLGIRTGINSVERLLNPANSSIAFLGVFHKPFMQKYVEIFAPRYDKLVIVKGNEGTSEIFSKCQYWIAEDGNITEYKIDPKDFGINYTRSWERITIEESLEAILNPSKELLNLAKLNAAFILFVSNKVKSIEEGYEIL